MELKKHLRKNALLVIMNKNDLRGTRDFVLIDHDNLTIYTGSTHGTVFDVGYVEKRIVVNKKSDLKREIEMHIDNGFKKKYINELTPSQLAQ